MSPSNAGHPVDPSSFCACSAELDRSLRFVADLSVEIPFYEDESLPEFGWMVLTYLIQRLALEHVFLGRSIPPRDRHSAQLKSEIWRLRKKNAFDRLHARTKMP